MASDGVTNVAFKFRGTYAGDAALAILEGAEQSTTSGTRSSVFADSTEPGVPKSVYLKWIQSQLRNENSCLELPTTILLLITFSLVAYWHLDQKTVFAVEQGIEQDIIENANFAFSHYFGHKGLHDVHSFADFWSWTRLGFLPLVIQPTWAYSEEYATDALAAARLTNAAAQPVSPEELWKFEGYGPSAKSVPIRGDYLHYHRIIGGIRFRQQVAQRAEELCVFPGTATSEQWRKWYGKPCMPAWEELTFDPTSEDAEQFSHQERVEWMLLDVDSYEDMIGMTVDMEDGCAQLSAKGRSDCLCKWCSAQNPVVPWLTEETQRVEIGFASFNANYGLITLTGVNFFFSRGGLISKRVEVMSSWMDPFSRPLAELIPLLVVDGIWLLLLLNLFVNEMKEICATYRAAGNKCRAILDDYVQFWNIVDWISFSVAMVVVSFFLQLRTTTSDMHIHFENLAALQQEQPLPGRDVLFEQTTIFYAALENVIECEKQFRLVLCIYPMVVMIRLFKSFAAQPRLAVVTETLLEGATDMSHFFIIFSSVLCCLCLDGIMLFGQDVKAFATFQRSIHTCFRMMFGDWDWAPMEKVRYGHAAFWFVLFMLMVVIILLNMLLAIVMESYMNVKKNAKDAISLPKQMQEMVRRAKQSWRRERMRLNDIFDIFLKEAREEGICEKDMVNSSDLITSQDLIDRGVPPHQAKRTLKNAVAEEKSRLSKPFELEDSVDIIRKLNQSTASNRDDLFFMFELASYWDNVTQFEEPKVRLSAEGEKGEAAWEMDANKEVEAFPTDAAATAEQSPEDFLSFVHGELGRLSTESANVLAQAMKDTEDRQTRIETRQADMLSTVNEMQETLQNLQNRAYMVLMQLQRNKFDSRQSISQWRRQEGGTVLPSCFDCSPGVTESPPLPPIPPS
eukprot:TRINITY_DN11317_c0_g2_i1.p1 TRINITY_DN11317_c0_g2~~TRINITY_DN11317_c0_g2_i1.p1  ORF type:complete len:907 (-),score=114.64 TRINITY_DN11317_c0_g2_i1:119-2839(-)